MTPSRSAAKEHMLFNSRFWIWCAHRVQPRTGSRGFRLDDDGVWPVEVARRPIGGLCAQALRLKILDTTERIGRKISRCGMRSICPVPVLNASLRHWAS